MFPWIHSWDPFAWATLIMKMPGDEWWGMNLKEKQIVFAQLGRGSGFHTGGLNKEIGLHTHLSILVSTDGHFHFHYYPSQPTNTKPLDA